jgi:8-oxo-dGTP diphosphatase
VHRDTSGRALTDYPRPSVAVDTAVLTAGERRQLSVLLVRWKDTGDWGLPGTFLHEGETLAGAVLRSLEQKAGLRGTTPRQLHVFDAPDRDDRGRVLSVAHVVVVPESVVEPVLGDDVVLRPVDEARGLQFDHDDIVQLAADAVRGGYRERPDPDGLLDEPFTMRELRHLHQAVLGGLPYSADTFRRTMLPALVEVEGARTEGTVGKPAQLYRKR